MPGEVVDGAAHVAGSAVRRQRLHEVRGFVHLVMLRDLAVIQIRSQRCESGGGKVVRPFLDIGIKTPPLLNHQNARPGPAHRRGEVP